MSQFFQGVTVGNLPPSVPITFAADIGTATASGNVLRIRSLNSGTAGLTTVATGDTVFVNLTTDAISYTNVTHAMSPYTVVATDYFISVDASAGVVTINLPDAPESNRQFVIKDRLGQAQTNNITVKSLTGASTIDQQATYTFVDNYESLECLFNGSNYEVF